MRSSGIFFKNSEPIARLLRPVLVCFGVFCLNFVWAQKQASATTRPVSVPKAASGTTKKVATPDEPLLFTLALTPEKATLSTDTLPDQDFRQFDPARKALIDYGTTGNLGSAARALLYDVLPQRGFDLGLHAFDLYALRPYDLKFFRNTRSFSDAFFSQGKNNLEAMLNARFARTFSDGINFSLEYRSVNNLGQYNYQRAKHNALVGGLWVPVGKRYDGFLIFSRDVMRQEDNGGIVSDAVFSGGQFQGPLAAAIRLPEENAHTRYDEQAIQLTQHYRLAGETGKRTLRATHTFEWSKQKYKFADGDTLAGLGTDAAYFGDFFVIDKGIRNFVGVNRFDNFFTINTFKAKKQGAPSDLLSLGIAHSYFRVNQEPIVSKFSNLFFTGKISLTPSEKFDFDADASLGVLKNIGEYQLNGLLSLGLGKAGILKARLLSQRRPPTLLQDRLYASKTAIWDTSFLKPVENTLSATYALPLAGFEATGRTILINNYLYYDNTSKAAQTTAPLQVVQLLVRENLKLGWFHLDNTIAYQKANRSDVFRLPQWFTKNSLYISGYLFKKRMLLTTGVDFRMNSEFKPDGYFPLTGQFHLQDTLTQKPYPGADVFLSFKVQAFRFFIRYDNCYTWFDKTKVFYQTALYPQPFGAIRLGIAWRFMDDNVKGPGENDGAGSSSGDPNAGGGIRSRKQ